MRAARVRALLGVVLAALGCRADERAAPPPPLVRASADGPTEWHREPVLDELRSEHVLLVNHADASLALEPALVELERAYAWLRDYTGVEPGCVVVHVGSRYPCGFAMRGRAPEGCPEVFLQAASIFDSQANVVHEMSHAFAYRFGALPHWFFESIADVAYADAEIGLWKRRKEAPFLATFDRVDHRSYELMLLRARYGAEYFPKVFRVLEARVAADPSVVADATPLEERNRLLLAVLSEAAGEDLVPLFTRELGFDPRTRERQRGY